MTAYLVSALSLAFVAGVVGFVVGCRHGSAHTWRRATELLNESTAMAILRMRMGIEQPGPEKRKDLPS